MLEQAARLGDPRFYEQTDALRDGARLNRLLDELQELHARKNHDYAKANEPLSNYTRARALGINPSLAVLVRLSDKFARIEQLVGGKVPMNEPLHESLVDVSVLSMIAILLLEDEA